MPTSPISLESYRAIRGHSQPEVYAIDADSQLVADPGDPNTLNLLDVHTQKLLGYTTGASSVDSWEVNIRVPKSEQSPDGWMLVFRGHKVHALSTLWLNRVNASRD